MKRILKTVPPPTEFIIETELPHDPIIGFKTRQGLVEKGFIQQHSSSPNLGTMRVSPITSGRLFRIAGPDYWRSLLSFPDVDYFLFDTEKELLLWLAE